MFFSSKSDVVIVINTAFKTNHLCLTFYPPINIQRFLTVRTPAPLIHGEINIVLFHIQVTAGRIDDSHHHHPQSPPFTSPSTPNIKKEQFKSFYDHSETFVWFCSLNQHIHILINILSYTLYLQWDRRRLYDKMDTGNIILHHTPHLPKDDSTVISPIYHTQE